MLVRSAGQTSAALSTSERDMLTQVLHALRLDGVEYGRCVMRTPWAIAFPSQSAARFHFVARGGAWLWCPALDWKRLSAGDAVLLPRGTRHVMASDPGVPAVDIAEFARAGTQDDVHFVHPGARAVDAQSHGTAVPTSEMFCGEMRFNLPPLHPLMALLPEAILAGDLFDRDPAIPALLEAMEREVALDRIGSSGMLARLADVLAAAIIRAWVEGGGSDSDSNGWVAAVHCPRIGKVIAAIQANPERDWSVTALADIMGASRSHFAQAFNRTVGDSPARYVAKVKMFQARRWIEHDGMRVAVAAGRLGYDSEASFNRAFKRIMGLSPGAVRRRAP